MRPTKARSAVLTMIHANAARITGDVLRVDRKFLVGMQAYVERIREPICSIHPEASPDAPMMDPVEVPIGSLGFKIATLPVGRDQLVVPHRRAELADVLSHTRLMYGSHFGSVSIARKLQVPYVPVLEYDLGTHVVFATSSTTNPVRRLVRATRAYASHRAEIPVLRAAAAIHCNGYPVFDETERLNARRLLYLDSRMASDMVMDSEALTARLAGRAGPLRLLFSGRYEHSKGALDAIKVALAAQRLGVALELHTFGQGTLKDEMSLLAAQSSQPGSIVVNEAIAYPILAQKAREFDAFVCCHIQSDPSCTYIESMGAGLPIAGYANRMWARLCAESAAGYAAPIGRIDDLARLVGRLAGDAETLVRMSHSARNFAAEHTFEHEFTRRTDSLNEIMLGGGNRDR
jgi:colanic acid/amylovoran biosynthesis glycosyltransferase